MDKQLMSALNNLSVALEMMAEALDKKGKGGKSATADALKSGNLDKKVQQINKGIQQLQSDNKKILKNQDTILSLLRKKGAEKDPMQQAADPKQKSRIKDGLASVLMIAVGVLAIGMAFKIIGKVNFLSVIALAIALPLVAMAFERIAKMKNLKAGDMKNLVLISVSMSLAIALSSWVLSMVKPVGIFKLFTAVFIAAMFGAISFGIGALLIGLKKAKINPVTDWKTLAALPLVMVAISLAIALSSYALQLIKPVGIFKLFTAVFIAAAFGVIAFGIGKILEGFKKAKIDKATAVNMAVVLPLVFIALSVAIAAASWVFQLIKPVGIFKLFTAILISAVFVILSYALKPIMAGISKVSYKDIVKAGAIMVVLSAAIVAASYLISFMPAKLGFGMIFKFLAVSVVLAIAVVALALVATLVNKLGGPTDYIKGGISILVIAGTIMLSSLILSLGKYDKYPSLRWALGVGLSLAAFGLGAVLLGTQALNPFFYAGLGVILGVAGTIVAASFILSKGKYDKFPPLKWAVSVSLILGAFAALSIALAVVFPLVALGSLSALAIVGTIWAIDKVFSKGQFKKYPTSEWVLPTLAILGGFAVVTAGLAIIFPLVLLGSLSALAIVGTIWAIDKIFSKGQFKKYPTMDWVKGVSSSIAGFTKLMSDTSFGAVLGGGLKSLFGGGIDDVAKKILKIDSIFSKGKFQKYPSKKWWEDVNYGVKSYVNLAKYLSKSGITSTGGMLSMIFGMRSLADGYSKLAEGVGKLGAQLEKIDVEKLTALKNLTGSIVLLSLMDSDQFEDMMDALEDKAKIFVDIMNDLDKSEPKKAGAGKLTPGVSVKSPAKASVPTKSLSDLFNVMQSIDQKLGTIQGYNENVSTYVDSIKSGDINLKSRKR